ncbi:16S rRNA (guanine(966)-N(2))-methyltransferase RsmD [Enemella sp. A6]|uniref:16S rRNA (guanine(966)-N(2))-methyltransferase RsmD n=1 Tax=Enemella sp. A6 TaxID=3440152 RepID=UPI003EB92479
MSRIIAGSRKGRRLQTPEGDPTRPTTDRVREAVFSALASWAGTVDEPTESALAGIGFVDLFAGSGAMALEAASRGAHPVLAVEADRATAELIRRNAETVDLPIRVLNRRVEHLTAPATAADVIWADPPYDMSTDELGELTDRLVADGWLVHNGLLVIERGAREEPWHPPAGWDSWNRRYGETIIYYAQPSDEE